MSRQDIENAAPVRIALAESMARTLGFKQLIVFGHSQESGTVITTWGEDAELSAQAAHGANYIKNLWCWPQDTIVESEKVTAIKGELAGLYTRFDQVVAALDEATRERDDALHRIKEMELQYYHAPRAKPTVHVIEGTEYERGWGCRPDGLVAFKSKEDAEAWIASYNARHNTAKTAPDEYTVYNYLGIRECSQAVLTDVMQKGFKHINRSADLLA